MFSRHSTRPTTTRYIFFTITARLKFFKYTYQCLRSGSIHESEDGQINLYPSTAILLTSMLHFDRQTASSSLKPTFTYSSSTCFLHVLFNLSCFPSPSTSKPNALLRTWPSSLLNTWHSQWTLFVTAIWPIASSSTTSTSNSQIQLYLLVVLHILCSPRIFLSFVIFQSHFLLGTMLHFHTVLLAEAS